MVGILRKRRKEEMEVVREQVTEYVTTGNVCDAVGVAAAWMQDQHVAGSVSGSADSGVGWRNIAQGNQSNSRIRCWVCSQLTGPSMRLHGAG